MPDWLKTLAAYFTTAAGALIALCLAFVSGKSTGKSEAETERLQDNVEAATDRKVIDEEVNRLSDVELDDALSKWVRK